MSLNIKNEHVHDLAREAARRTGRNLTSAIELALEQLLATLDAEAQDRDLDALIEKVQQAVARAEPLSDHDLYDDAGLPR